MTVYTIQQGDTFESISRKVYGVETDAPLLRSANPDATEPLLPGLLLTIPANKKNLINARVPAGNKSTLFLNGAVFENWETITYKKQLDGFSGVQFTAPFNPDDNSQRIDFRPYTYPQVGYAIGEDVKFFGYLPPTPPQVSKEKVMITPTAKSFANLLSKCQFSPRLESLEFSGQKLDNIATTLCNSLALRPVIVGDVGPVFEKAAANPEQFALEFLAELARQRGFVISDNEDGQPVFWQSASDGTPVANLIEGEPAVDQVTVNFTDTYYSHISAISSSDFGDSGSLYTVKNDRLSGFFMPHVFKPTDTAGANAKDAATAKMGRMFANSVSYNVRVPSWRDPAGNLWDVNTFVNMIAPSAMCYTLTKFLVRGIDFVRNKNSEWALLNLVLPGAFSGEIPEFLPWED